MVSDDVYFHQLQRTIEGLRYWVPSIADVAQLEEEDISGTWRLEVSPKAKGACAFELLLHPRQTFDIVIAGETYASRPVSDLSMFLPLAQAITEGRVIQRHWMSSGTATARWIETLVFLPGDAVWQDNGEQTAIGRLGFCESRDRHFLPYRR